MKFLIIIPFVIILTIVTAFLRYNGIIEHRATIYFIGFFVGGIAVLLDNKLE